MVSRSRAALFSLFVYLAFFASGAASLMAEVTWSRMLIVVVGNSISAAAMIIGVFMGGLGLGSFAGGRYLGRRKPSLVPYLLLEATIGIYVLLSPVLFRVLSHVFTSLGESVSNQAALTLVRLVVTTAALALPAFMMGATFPAMISGATPDSPTRRSARIGYLYSINTLGAAIGCFVGGYHLLLEFGVQTTLLFAFGLYMLAAGCAVAVTTLLRGEEARGSGAAEPTESRPGPRSVSGRVRLIYVATVGVGFVALAYEVLLTRLSILYLGNSVSVFPMVLTAFLLGTGISSILGTWLYGRLQRTGAQADRLFGVTALAAGAFVLLTPYLLLSDRIVSAEQIARLTEAAPRNPWTILGIIVVPTIFLGAMLPVAIRMLQGRERSSATRGAASLYALNTAGGLIGAGLANHYLVPTIGVHGVLLILAGICVGVGFAQLLYPGRRTGRWVALGAGVVLLVGTAWMTVPKISTLHADKLARSTGAASAKVMLAREGRAATVTVIDQADPKLGTYRDMYLNGVEEASTRYWHTQLFKLLGAFPVLIHESDQPKDVLVVAFGAGITAGSVLASDEVASLDVVDLNPDVEGINNLFVEVNGDVYHQPRFHFHNDDGRNYLVTSGKKYDLIISDSTHPRAYDSWILYTEEFYQSVKRRLRPGGIFAQWVPVLGSMRGELVSIHLNTFRSVFPHTTFWYVYGSDQAFLLATPEPFSLDSGALQKKLDRLPAWFRAGEYQIDTAARVAGFFWMDEPAMGRMIGNETRINRDDAHFFDKQSAVWPLPPQRQLPAYQASVLPYLRNSDPELRSSAGDQQVVAQLLGRFAFYDSAEDLFNAYCFLPENGDVRYFMDLKFSGHPPDHEDFCGEREIAQFRITAEREPNNPLALNALADRLIETGKLDEGVPLAERAVGLDPGNGMILDTYGWGLHRQGKHQAALTVLRKAAAALPGNPIVLYHLGAVCLANGDRQLAREYLQTALRTSGDFPGAEAARQLLRDAG
jgi:spermidine synthase